MPLTGFVTTLWVFCTKDTQLDIIHIVKEDREKARGLEMLKRYDIWCASVFPERLLVKTKLIQSKENIEKAIKRYTEENNAKVLVLAAPKPGLIKHVFRLGSIIEYCQRSCKCPVVIVKKERRMDIKTPQVKVSHVAIAVDTNVPSDNAINWVLADASLSSGSTLVLVHAVEKATEKREARKFLASFQPRCIASKKDYTMKSGLVYFKGKSLQESIVKYCHDYGVDLLILAPGLQSSIPRLTSSVSDQCSRNVDCDVLIWKGEGQPTTDGKPIEPYKKSRTLSLDNGSVPKAKSKAKPRRFSMGADEEELADGPPEEVSYVFGYDTQTLSP